MRGKGLVGVMITLQFDLTLLYMYCFGSPISTIHSRNYTYVEELFALSCAMSVSPPPPQNNIESYMTSLCPAVELMR